MYGKDFWWRWQNSSFGHIYNRFWNAHEEKTPFHTYLIKPNVRLVFFPSFSKVPLSVHTNYHNFILLPQCWTNQSRASSLASTVSNSSNWKAFLTYFAYQYKRPRIETPFYFRRLLSDGFSLQECCLWVKWKCHHELRRGPWGGVLSDTDVSLQLNHLPLGDESW